MYKITGRYAIEFLTSGRNEEDEFNEMIELASQGDETFIILDELPDDVELIERDYI